ncbi:MAG: tetratricopeptide repeat protein [Pyrinomonadaceae bacterium]
MSEHFISREDAGRNMMACAAYLAESIQSGGGRAQAMIAVVPRFLEKGEVDLAAELANTVDDPFVRDRLLIAVAEKCASADDDEYAMQLVAAMDDPGLQSQGREKVGLMLASVGEIDKARSVADMMNHRDNVLAGIAVRQHSDGAIDAAIETVGEIGFPAAAAHAFVTMAAAAIEKGDAEQAVDVLERSLGPAEEIEHEEERIRTLTDIANSFLAAGRNDRAIEVFDRAREHSDALGNVHRDNFLSAIALGFLRAGSLDLADRTLDLVQDKTQIATALLGFAREFWTRGEKTEALDALDEAYAILRSQRESETRDSKARFARYADIAIQYAGFEKGERGIEIAHEIIDEEVSMKALAQIARILLVQRNDAIAQQALNDIPDNEHRMFALVVLSDTAAANGERERAIGFLDEAKALVEEVPQLASRASAYVEFARRFAKFEETESRNAAIDRGLETIAAIRDESTKAAALVEMAVLTDDLGIDAAESYGEVLDRIVTRSLQQSF